jgi:para-aminobenzoate synthetase / 4-amino-4-deoxychorismate lyase
MIRAVFGSNSSRSSWALTLSAPSDVLVAYDYGEVIRLIQAAEDASRRGSYVAILLTYEASPSFDNALITHRPTNSLPLAWAAIFSEAETFPNVEANAYQSSDWIPAITEIEYRVAIDRILELIAAGATYQVNYSFPMTATFEGDPFSYYLELTRAQGARYSAFIDTGDFQILSLSPELFFERTDNLVRTKPMKGTVQRGRWTAEDEQFARWLSQSTKDRAENVMIVDLLRNDLGKVSKTGSVKVSELFELERFETLWQMTSTVEATLEESVGLAELLGALFPCGSITGAPKISTMKIINQLERYPRGVYTGAIGLLRPGGNCTFNVAIRTLQLHKKSGVLTFGVGGGVTFDSTPEREYAECLVKSAFLRTTPSTFQLLETMLLENGDYFLLSRHLSRLSDSADFFGFRFVEQEVTAELERLAAAHAKERWRVRLLLSKDGKITTEIAQKELRSHIRRVVRASKPVDSANRMLFHKTTDRSAFRLAGPTSSDYEDVLFFNERGEVTESANANVVVPIDGELWTPPVSSGLLAGTFREQLLIEGKIKERVITVAELLAASEFFLINSVQKWMRATINSVPESE